MYDKTQFQQHLGKEKNFPNYLAFFQQEIEKKGVADVLNEYLFSGSECAETMLARLFGGEWTCRRSSCSSIDTDVRTPSSADSPWIRA
jgi:hypothetical protein